MLIPSFAPEPYSMFILGQSQYYMCESEKYLLNIIQNTALSLRFGHENYVSQMFLRKRGLKAAGTVIIFA